MDPPHRDTTESDDDTPQPLMASKGGATHKIGGVLDQKELHQTNEKQDGDHEPGRGGREGG